LPKEDITMEFLVRFEINAPEGTSESEVESRQRAEAIAVAELADQGHVIRIWNLSGMDGGGSVLGLYRADTEAELDTLLNALPLSDWMDVTVTPLETHPNDPQARRLTTSSVGRG
jgi:muconolactone D-isomerase